MSLHQTSGWQPADLSCTVQPAPRFINVAIMMMAHLGTLFPDDPEECLSIKCAVVFPLTRTKASLLKHSCNSLGEPLPMHCLDCMMCKSPRAESRHPRSQHTILASCYAITSLPDIK